MVHLKTTLSQQREQITVVYNDVYKPPVHNVEQKIRQKRVHASIHYKAQNYKEQSMTLEVRLEVSQLGLPRKPGFVFRKLCGVCTGGQSL